MSEHAICTLEQLEPELRGKLLAAAEREQRPAAEIVAGIIDAHFQEQRQASYSAYLRRCVEAGDADIRAGRTFSNEEVEAMEDAALAALEAGAPT
jgi:predicted transcriptional regulator